MKKIMDPISDGFVETLESFGTGMKANMSMALRHLREDRSVSPMSVSLMNGRCSGSGWS